MSLPAIRRNNVLILFGDFVAERASNGAEPLGLAAKFAEKLQISASMWSQIKKGRVISDKLRTADREPLWEGATLARCASRRRAVAGPGGGALCRAGPPGLQSSERAWQACVENHLAGARGLAEGMSGLADGVHSTDELTHPMRASRPRAFATPAPYAGSALAQLPMCRRLMNSGASPMARAVFSNSTCCCAGLISRNRSPGCW